MATGGLLAVVVPEGEEEVMVLAWRSWLEVQVGWLRYWSMACLEWSDC